MSVQVYRSGTSIGANIAESDYAISKADFVNKTQIALKEAAETKYWIDLLYETNYVTEEQYNSLNFDCQELLKILTSILNTAKK